MLKIAGALVPPTGGAGVAETSLESFEEPTALVAETSKKYVVSFVGFMPADDPAFVTLVLLDEAHAEHGKNYGGQVAGPVFSRIAEKAARYLGLKPTEPIPPLNKTAASQSNDSRDQ